MKDQLQVMELFSNLFASGFHFSEIVDFLKRSQLLPASSTQQMEDGLLRGAALSEILDDLGFSSSVTTQVSLAERHGHLEQSLALIRDYLISLRQVRRKLSEVATYPIILLAFLMLIMLGLKNYLLPQLDDGNFATTLIGNLPLVTLACGGLVVSLLVLAVCCYRRSNKIRALSFLSRLPVAGPLIQTYLTAYYAREWGSMMDQGMELPDVVDIMSQQKSPLFRTIGQDLGAALSSGQAFHTKIASYPFFKKELPLMIEYGQVKAKLGKELSLYAGECWKEFFTQLNRKMQWIQPLVFFLVAILIVLIYVAMLLPIYNSMEF